MTAGRLRLGVAIVAVAFVLALVLGSAGLLGGGQALGAATTVTVLGGDVFVRHGSNGSFVAAVDGEVLAAGDAIRTSTDARAVLTYFEGSTVTIEPDTQLSIAEAAASNGVTRISMTQDFGRTWHVVTHLLNSGSKYEVRTPASTASVRGTEFQVDTDGQTTRVTTTEGTVVDQVPDPARAGATVDVPVPAGQQHTQPVNAPAAPIHPAPEPERKVTVTVGATNSLVVDPLGRTNGVTADGKIVVQTPGARVRREGDSIVIELPDIPDGKIATFVDQRRDVSAGDVAVRATIRDHGRSTDIEDAAKRGQGATASTGFDIERGANGDTQSRKLDDSEKKDLKGPRIAGAPVGVNDTQQATPSPARNVETSETPKPTGTARPESTSAPTSSPDERASETPRGPAPTNERVRTPEPTEPTETSEPARTPDPKDTPKSSPKAVPSFVICIPTASANCGPSGPEAPKTGDQGNNTSGQGDGGKNNGSNQQGAGPGPRTGPGSGPDTGTLHGRTEDRNQQRTEEKPKKK